MSEKIPNASEERSQEGTTPVQAFSGQLDLFDLKNQTRSRIGRPNRFPANIPAESMPADGATGQSPPK